MSDFHDFSKSDTTVSTKAESGQDDSQYRSIFLQELFETIQNLESNIIDLEANSSDKEKINSIFRLFHNLKGSSAMMEFNIIKEVAHYSESLLNIAREGRISVGSRHIDAFLNALSALKELAENIREKGQEGEERYFSLLQILVDLAKESQSLESDSVASPEETKAKNPVAKSKSDSDQIKVSREVIEQMMLLVGEFMQLKNKIRWLADRYRDRDYDDHCEELDHFSAKLQRNILKLRLSPIKPVLQAMQRVARTTAQQTGKKVDFELAGEETLLDRSILDILGDPLMHIVRNAIDHGLENGQDRLALNKTANGSVVVKASYKSGEVHLSVSDDGGGIDSAVLKAIGVEKGFINSEQAEAMTHQDALQLMFLPGFSGASKVTETSGRGVGMDVVKASITAIGGEIEIQTEIGTGTTFTIRLPLSLAIVDCLGFRVGTQTYAVPQLNVEEVLSFNSTFVQENMRCLESGANILTVRNTPIPILNLADLFDIKGGVSQALIQVRHLKSRFILEVGDIIGPLSIVSQAVPRTFSKNAPFSGITTQGDGSLLFQLDIAQLSKFIDSISPEVRKSSSQNRGVAGTSQEGSLMTSSDVRRLQQKTIAFTNNLNFCIPVQRAKRIVFVTKDKINSIGHNSRSFITLEQQTIALIWVEEIFLNQKRIDQENYSVLIFNSDQSLYGIPMACFQGIKRMPDTYETELQEQGILGTTIIDDQTYLCLDIAQLISLHLHGPQSKPNGSMVGLDSAQKSIAKPRILCAEDDKFFATELTATLRAANFEVIMFEDGLLAKDRLSDVDFAKSIDLCVTDIEMPRLTGLGLTRWMMAQDHTRTIPIVAYTAITTQEMKQKMLSAGAKAFVSKMSLDELVTIIRRLLNGEDPYGKIDDQSEAASIVIDRTVTFRLGNDWYGIPMKNIKEVSPISISAAIPGSRNWVNEVTSFRGAMIPVIDLRRYIGLNHGEIPTEQAIVEVEGIIFALKVGKIGEVIINDNMHRGEGISKITQSQKTMAQFVKEVCRYDDQTILIIDPITIADVLNNVEESIGEECAA